jgi:hypothetical protein
MKRKYFLRRINYLSALGTMFIFLEYVMIFYVNILVLFAKMYKMLFIGFWKTVKWIFQKEGERENAKEKS